MPGGFAARQPPPAPPSVHPVERTWFDQEQEPYRRWLSCVCLRQASPSLVFLTLLFCNVPSRAPSNFTRGLRRACWMVGVGGIGQSCPLPVGTSWELCPCLLDGAERSLMGHCERYATALQVQGCTSPPPASCFRVAGLLSRVLVLAAYAHSPEPGYQGRRSCLRAQMAGRIGSMHNGVVVA